MYERRITLYRALPFASADGPPVGLPGIAGRDLPSIHRYIYLHDDPYPVDSPAPSIRHTHSSRSDNKIDFVMPLQLSSTSGKQALDDLLQSSVDSREVPAVFFGVTNAEGTLYLNCAGEKHFGDESEGEVDEDTSES